MDLNRDLWDVTADERCACGQEYATAGRWPMAACCVDCGLKLAAQGYESFRPAPHAPPEPFSHQGWINRGGV